LPDLDSLNPMASAADTKDYVDGHGYDKGWTNTGQAFKSCQELLANSVVIGPDPQKVIIMLTDGKSLCRNQILRRFSAHGRIITSTPSTLRNGDFRTGNPSAYVDRAGDCPYGRAETRPAPPTSILTNVYRRRDGAEGTRNSRRCADKWALEARDQGTRVISIGIGPNIDDTALCTWASGKGNEGVYEVDFGNINSILDSLVLCGNQPVCRVHPIIH